jgi:hypothetical protein
MSRIVIFILIYHRHKTTNVMKGLFLNKSYITPLCHLATAPWVFRYRREGQFARASRHMVPSPFLFSRFRSQIMWCR